MRKKTFTDRKKDKIELAKFVMEETQKHDITIPELQQAKEILKNPYESTKQDVKDIATVAASIYEVGLPSTTPEVKKWAKKELGMTPDEFGDILDQADTEEEVKVTLLEEIETPQEIIAEVKEEIQSKKK